MTNFTYISAFSRKAAILVALCTVVLTGVLLLERSFSPIVELNTTFTAHAEAGAGDGDGPGGGDGGGGCCGGGDGPSGVGGDTGAITGDFPVTPIPPVDVCPNIAGDQTSVPPGYTIVSGNCVIIVDICPNIAGIQTSVPPGLVIDSNGNCNPPPCTGSSCVIDICPNIAGNQSTVPSGLTIDSSGNCVPPPCTGSSCTPCVGSSCNPPPCINNCGGGLNQPNVSLFRTPGEQPLAFVTLSQIPYTGFDAGPVATALFWMLLVAWSALVAWLIVVKRVPQNLIEKYAGISSHAEPRIIHEEKVEPMAHVSNIMPSALAMPMPHMGHTEREVPVSRFASQKITTPVSTKAHVAEVVTPAPVAPKAESIYTETPVALGETSDYVSAVPLFIGWIAKGESEKAFDFLRNLRLTQKSAQDFMEKTVCELDAAYRCRIDSTGVANEHTTAAVAHMTTGQIEKLIEALASAVDRSYGSDFTSAKIALVRALGVKGEKTETNVSAPTSMPAYIADEVEAPRAAVSAPKASVASDYVDEFIMSQINRLRK